MSATPGPWIQNVLLVQDTKGEQIAHCTRWENGRPMPEVAEANARLIAVAPDLLDACKLFVARVEAGEVRSTQTYRQMKALIARAEGKT